MPPMAATVVETRADDARTSDEALGERLIAEGKLDRAGLQRALRLCEAGTERLHLVLIKLASCLARSLSLPGTTCRSPANDYLDLPLRDRVSVNFLKEVRVLPSRNEDGIAVV
jgi:hypothetical protein